MAAKEEPAIIGKILIVLLVLITLAGNIFLLSGNTEQETNKRNKSKI